MTKTHCRRFLHFFRLHHGFSLVVTSSLLYPPRAAAQTELTPPPPPPTGSAHNITLNPAITIVLFCLLSSFFLLCFFFIYVRQCIERRFPGNVLLVDNEVRAGHRPRRRGLDPSLIDAFPTFMYSEVKGLKIGKGSLECAVCLDEFEDDELLRLLPKCSHVFHPDCIDAWLSSHITCPVCRADCSPDRSETFPVTLPSDQDSGFEVSELGFSPDNDIDDHNPQRLNSNRMVDDDLVTNAQSPEAITDNNIQTTNQNFPVRNAKKQIRRSQSTGPTLVQPCENCERFTLRLPEEVRNQLVMNSTTLSRAKSCVAFPRAASARKGYRSTSGGNEGRRNLYNYERVDRDGRSNRWGCRVTPPSFLNCAGSRGSPVGSGGEGSTSSGKTLLKSVTLPLQRLFGGTDGNKENTNAGERSLDGLRLDDRV